MRPDRYRSTETALWRSLDVEPDERLVHLLDIGAPVRVQRLGNGPPLLFIHGASVAGTAWAQLAALLPDRECWIVDRPGCGLSPPLPGGFADVAALERFADRLVPDLLDALELERADVVGTSLGGYLTLRSAAASPGRVRRLIEFGWSLGAPTDQVPLIMRLASVPAIGWITARVPPTRKAVEIVMKQIGMRGAIERGQVSAEMQEWFFSLQRDTGTLANEIASGPRVLLLRGVDPALEHADDLLARITMPTRYVWGEQDPFGGGEVARRFIDRLPNASLDLWPDAGHAPWVDDPARAAEIVRRFTAV